MFKIGDKVSRLMFGNVKKHGIIVDIAKSRPDHQGNSHDLYSIRWDGEDHVEKGYLEISLRREE